MNAFHLAILLSTVAVAFQSPSSHQRRKRSLGDLKGIIRCTTGRSFYAYLWYGCYCGLGGHGEPKDETDKCCQTHDCCYENAINQGCSPVTDDYQWTCNNGRVSCDHLSGCERTLCECDRDAGNCLNAAPYIWYYALWPNTFCRSGKECDVTESPHPL
uniref:phospholipase A2-like n=1 Tax=Doryrhamphus excisus TaxID=161450 RepID=UPI0025AE5CDE|nr:phospholipase A2-like [Doryrhamphus excisus]